MDQWKTVTAKAEASHGIITRLDLLGAGMSPAQVERWRRLGRLVDLTSGVYRIGGAPPTYPSEVLAAVRSFGGKTWASHGTAARLWGLGLDTGAPLVEVTRPKPLSAGRCGIHVHRSTSIPSHHVTTLHGIPITSPARTVFDLARSVGPRRLDRAVQRATQERLCTVAALYRVLYDLGGRGRPGTRRLRAVLDRWDAEAPVLESELDAIGRALLSPIGGIEWQVRLADERGHIRTVDGLVRSVRLVIEFDGVAFHQAPEVRALDDDQDRRLVAAGFTVRRYGWDDLTRRSDITLAEVHSLVDRAAA